MILRHSLALAGIAVLVLVPAVHAWQTVTPNPQDPLTLLSDQVNGIQIQINGIRDEIRSEIRRVEEDNESRDTKISALEATIGTPPAIATTRTINGTITVFERSGAMDILVKNPFASEVNCSVGGGYDLESHRTRVWVLNESGKLVGLSRLSTSHMDLVSLMHGDPMCTFDFAVDVPDSDFYEFAVGRRDKPIPSQEDLIYSRAEIEAMEASGGVSINLGL